MTTKFNRCPHYITRDWQNGECPYCMIYDAEARLDKVIGTLKSVLDEPLMEQHLINGEPGYAKLLSTINNAKALLTDKGI